MHPASESSPAGSSAIVRLATEADRPAIEQLFLAGHEDGQLRPNDTGADIRHLEAGYPSDGGSSAFWVAVLEAEVVGMIGVQRTTPESADIRRLRVRRDRRRRGIGSQLLETAIDFCRDQGYLKVVLDVNVDRAPAVAMFRKFGFTNSRGREIGGRKTLDFYLDLYGDGSH